MKGILCACVLVWLESLSVAHAYETDIHYSTTYVLARAVGWSVADARTIASANEGVDQNHDTVAALEVDATPGHAGYVMSSFRQADKNLKFHCFSRTREQGARIAADVREVMAGHFSEVPDHDDDPRSNARKLIALGVALHCQQDAYSHVGFGGSCGPYPGSCHGHTHETFLDQVVFGLLNKHHFNPDHPGVSGERLLEALQETASELAARRPKGLSRAIQTHELVALSDALRASGLELPDEVRRDCNRHVAGKWLYDFFRTRGRAHDSADHLKTLAPRIAGTCENASLGSASVVRIPEPRFPRLNPDASPYLVSTDGTYQLAESGDLGAALPGIHEDGVAALPANPHANKIKVRLSHWRQFLALPLMMQVALLSEDGKRKRQ